MEQIKFLKTNLTQLETAKILVEKLQSSIKELLYNVKRYNVPVSIVLFHTTTDVSEQLDKHKRLTDVLDVIKIGNSYFNVIFLPFTTVEDAHSFVNYIELKLIDGVKSHCVVNELKKEQKNCLNFINSFLFGLTQSEEPDSLPRA